MFSTILAVILLSITFTVAGETSIASVESATRENTIILGRISNNPKKHHASLQAMADYLATKLTHHGIDTGSVVFAKDNEQMIELINQGHVDVISETVFSAIDFHEQAGAEIALKRHKKGVGSYSSVIFVKKDSDISSFKDLVGKTIAFQDDASTSSFYVPSSILMKEGYTLHHLQSPREEPPATDIGFVFANKEINISTWVNKGIVEAGALSDINWRDPEDMPDMFRENSRIIYESESFPRGIELFSPHLAKPIKEDIKRLLLNAHKNEEGAEVLYQYQKTTRFEDLSENSASIVQASKLRDFVNMNFAN